MAIRDREVSDANRASIVDLVSIVIAMASLFVSMSALVVSVVVWKRPFPADPTAIPTFGQNGSPETIDAGNGGRKFFAFLEKHPGRKIRIIARVVEDDRIKVRERGRVLEIHECMRPDCYVEQLSINVLDKETDGFEWRGEWVLEGYFANDGIVRSHMGFSYRQMTAIDIVTAVS